MCVNDYFGKKLLNLPQKGVFLWHEGITPEYRGLYSAFWAIHNLDFDNIGYTLLKMNQKIDAGDIYVQGKGKDIDPFSQTHSYIGHKMIWDSLDSVETFLKNLEKDQAKPIIRQNYSDGYYTYPGLSDYFRMKCRLNKLKNH
jgi:methionyl-tRNA formyltransferase